MKVGKKLSLNMVLTKKCPKPGAEQREEEPSAFGIENHIPNSANAIER